MKRVSTKKILADARHAFEAEAGESLTWATGVGLKFMGLAHVGFDEGVDTQCAAIEQYVEDLARDREGVRARLERLLLATGAAMRVPGAVDVFVREYGRAARPRKRMLRDPAYVQICDCVGAAAAGYPGRAFLMLHPNDPQPDDNPVHHPLVKSGRESRDALVAWAAFRSTRAKEARARALMHAIDEVLEAPYKSLLRTLWRIHHAAPATSTLLPPVDLGRLVDQLAAAFPALVSRNAKVLRKAIAHRHWIYVAQRDAIEYWNVRHSDGRVVERRTVPVTALAGWCERLLFISTAVLRAARDRALADMLVDGGVLKALLEAVAAHPVPEETLNSVMEAVMARQFGVAPALDASGARGAS